MSCTVKLSPSGHSFEAEGSESVLAAGLRAGLNLQYRCSSGSCGECRARLIGGSIEPCGHGDFVMSEAERERGDFLMCRNRAVTDIEIETNEIGASGEIPQQHIRARVAKIERLQDDVVQLHLRTPRTETLRFLAGQSVTLCLDGMRPRTLPIASCPCDGGHLRFHLRRRRKDVFSDLVFERLKRHREVVLSGPSGDFTLDEESQRPLLMLAWESGFAPVQSIIDHVISQDPDRLIHLYWLSGFARGHYLSNTCRTWVDALDNFHYHSVDLEPAGEETFASVLQSIVEQHAPLADWDLYLAIPAHAQYRVCTFLCDAGVAATQMHLALCNYP